MTAATRRRSWRWLRLAIPLGVAVLILAISGVTHAMQSPDVTDPAFLNPDSGSAIGGRVLAQRLRGLGVDVQRVGKSSDALVAAAAGDATLFIPAPGLMHPFYLRMLKLLPAGTRVVLVAPSQLTLNNGHLPVDGASTRWTTAVAAPACPMPEAVAAGRAAIAGTRYGKVAEQTERCYSGALVGLRVGTAEVLLAGANDLFRNDRIGEYHNGALATALLGTHHRLVWLDLHQREPQPGFVHQNEPVPAAPPSLGDGGSPDPDFPINVAPSQSGEVGARPGGGGGGADPNPLWSAFPGWMWAALILLGLIALVLALAFGRRLGPPVSEPLPVLVRAAETVEGRGRLYRRAKARGPALDALRSAARRRLRPALGLEPDASPEALVHAVAARTGYPVERVHVILYGDPPADDKALVRAAEELDALVYRALHEVDVPAWPGLVTVGVTTPATAYLRPQAPPPGTPGAGGAARPDDYRGDTR